MKEPERRILSRAEILDWVDKVFSIPGKERNFSDIHASKLLGRNPTYLREIWKRQFNINELMQVRFSKVIYELGEPKRVNPQGRRRPRREEIPEEIYVKFAKAIAAMPWDVAKALGLQTYMIKTCKDGGVPLFYKKTLRRLYRRVTGEPFNY